MRVFLPLLVLLHWLPSTLALKGDSACRRDVCVTAMVEGDMVNYEVTGLRQPMGWLALGFGKQMINTHSVIMWMNDDGTTTLSQRYTTGFREPRPVSDPPRVASLVEPKSMTRPAQSTTFAFQMPLNRSLVASADPREAMVYAYSRDRPDKDAASTLSKHRSVGYFSLDLTKELPSTGMMMPKPPSKPAMGTNVYKRLEKLIILHGSLVSLGFLVVLPAGSLIGRWGRSFTPKWFKAHWISNMAIALPVITLGVLLGPAVVYSKESFRIHFANAHEIYGMVLLFIYYAQVLLGRYIHKRRLQLAQLGPITRPHPPLNILHIALGVSIIALAFFQVRSGLEWWETLTGRGPITSWALPLWKAWIVVLPVAYFAGYALLPRQLRLEREAAYAPLAVASSDRDDRSHLLAEDDEDPAHPR
ncbi:hypothetical protein GALMADRAFT_251147 [Galerina marginata CBS 339.88]|uniref:DOMON domain-containing protein n=1 Tax=Galerina marginata (strain CBS 339.88) TaxID=685588 RepID=A0A067SRD0_GALM3|nr:hypothetical protein GALMADRAFT_251147 [Galerina marginata CBS 339.88]